jgi:preprotein translocase subunit SecD
MQARPNITQTLSSLKSAMTADKDQIIEEDYDEKINVELEASVSDEAVEVAADTLPVHEDETEEVFSSEDHIDDAIQEVKSEPVVSNPGNNDVFVLSKMIQEDGSVKNISVETPRPNVGMSDEKIEVIVREEAKSLLREWIDKNMYHILKKRKDGK